MARSGQRPGPDEEPREIERMARTAAEIIAEIQDLFLEDSIPWVIGYSGGKDSTASLQLIWQSLSELPEDKRQSKKVYVISTDTLVENPVISFWVRSISSKSTVVKVRWSLWRKACLVGSWCRRREVFYWGQEEGILCPSDSSRFAGHGVSKRLSLVARE